MDKVTVVDFFFSYFSRDFYESFYFPIKSVFSISADHLAMLCPFISNPIPGIFMWIIMVWGYKLCVFFSAISTKGNKLHESLQKGGNF